MKHELSLSAFIISFLAGAIIGGLLGAYQFLGIEREHWCDHLTLRVEYYKCMSQGVKYRSVK